MQTCSLLSALPLYCLLLQVFAFNFLAPLWGGAQSLGPPLLFPRPDPLGSRLGLGVWGEQVGPGGGEWVGRAWAAGAADNLKNYVNFAT